MGYGEDEAMSSLHVQDFTDSGCNALMTIVTDGQGSSEEVRDLEHLKHIQALKTLETW